MARRSRSIPGSFARDQGLLLRAGAVDEILRELAAVLDAVPAGDGQTDVATYPDPYPPCPRQIVWRLRTEIGRKIPGPSCDGICLLFYWIGSEFLFTKTEETPAGTDPLGATRVTHREPVTAFAVHSVSSA